MSESELKQEEKQIRIIPNCRKEKDETLTCNPEAILPDGRRLQLRVLNFDLKRNRYTAFSPQEERVFKKIRERLEKKRKK